MNNLFDGYRQMADEEIRLQIALFRCITFSNTIKEKGQKAVKFIMDTVSDFFGTGDIKVTDIRKMVEQVYDQLSEESRSDLDKMLKEELINICKSLCDYNFVTEGNVNDIDEDEISTVVIREAAKTYGIDEYKTPLVKADEIYDKYFDQYATVLQKKLIRLTQEEKKHYENRIQNAIIKGDIKRTRELANTMMLSEFNGKTVLTTISTPSRLPTLKKVLNVMGVGIFDGISCIIATAYDSMLSFCRVERLLLAQSVWNVEHETGRMSLSFDLMPSYIDEFGNLNTLSGEQVDENSRIMEREKKLLLMSFRENEYNQRIKSLLDDIKKCEKQRAINEQSYTNDLSKLTLNQDELAVWLDKKIKIAEEANKAKEEYDTYLENNLERSNSDVVYRTLKYRYEEAGRSIRNCEQRINTLKNNVGRYSETTDTLSKTIKNIEHELTVHRNQLVILVSEYNELIFELENEAGYRASILKKKWERAFVELKFSRYVFEKTVKRFSTREIVRIELMLTEMTREGVRKAVACEEIKDKDTVSYVTYAVVNGKKYAKILYKDNEIIDISVRGKN